jgi:predicted transcriptional regulator
MFTLMEVLKALREEPRMPTRLGQICNIRYDRLDAILGPLEERKLIRKEMLEGHLVYGITPEGLKIYNEWEGFWGKLWTELGV